MSGYSIYIILLIENKDHPENRACITHMYLYAPMYQGRISCTIEASIYNIVVSNKNMD